MIDDESEPGSWARHLDMMPKPAGTDRKVLCALEADRQRGSGFSAEAVRACIRAIELWEQGYGR